LLLLASSVAAAALGEAFVLGIISWLHVLLIAIAAIVIAIRMAPTPTPWARCPTADVDGCSWDPRSDPRQGFRLGPFELRVEPLAHEGARDAIDPAACVGPRGQDREHVEHTGLLD
jgi:hypothetical protein